MNKKLLFIIATVMLFSLVVFSGCDNRVTDLDNINITSMTISPNEVAIGDTLTAFVNVIVKDDDGFAVTNTKVLFKSTEGSMDPASIYTDSSGVAKVEFDYSTISLNTTVTVEAFVIDKDSGITAAANIVVGSASIPAVRSLAFEDSPISLQVAGTGGTESAELNVYIYNSQNELITEPKDISFKFLNGPLGIILNNEVVFPQNESVVVTSLNGIATVSISSGLYSGSASIEASILNIEGDLISATKSSIIVQAGPPNSIQFIMPGHSSADDMGAGTWKVEICALINDTYGNPVGDGTSVFFSLTDLLDPDLQPDYTYASLETQFCYVGNENSDGDTLAGAAFAFLNYDGFHTNDEVRIKVVIGGSLSVNETITLPIQFPSLDLVAVPQHLDWIIPGDVSPKVTTIHVAVLDGQENRINNQQLYFTSSLGEGLLQTAPNIPSELVTYYNNHLELGITGEVNVEFGRVNKPIAFNKYECPPPSPGGPGTTTATLTVTILGTNTSDNITIILFRYVD